MFTRKVSSRTIALITFVALISFTSVAWSDSWDEQGEAGNLPATSNVTTGSGILDSINGAISSVNDVDVYKIFVTGGGTFSASTHTSDGGSSGFDTMLFLFDENGLGVYTNDDVDTSWRSRLPASNPLTPVTPGIYYLVITSWENDPVSSGGQIFPNLDDNFDVFGPTGPGGGSPVSGYDGEGSESGSYHIVLTGAEFATIDPANAIDPSMSASWYNPNEAGHGIMIHLLDEERAWMCWFTFDLDGNPAWICALGNISGGTIVFADAFTVTGGNFPPLFDASQIVEVPWGSITVTFTGCDSGRMEWSTTTAGFQSGSMPLVRLTSLWGNECL